jgi:hypothetical protein
MVKYTRERSIVLNTLFKGLQEVYEKNLGDDGKIALSKKLLSMPEHKKNL